MSLNRYSNCAFIITHVKLAQQERELRCAIRRLTRDYLRVNANGISLLHFL